MTAPSGSTLLLPDLSVELKYPPGCTHFCTGYHAPFVLQAIMLDSERTAAIEVGAHVGLITRWLALNYPFVLAFEPDRVNRTFLRENVQARNVRVSQFALADRKGQGYSALSPTPTNSGGATTMWTPPGEPVAVTTIDDLAPPACSFLKVDVQGIAAVDVLKGARATLERFRPVVWCEGKPAGPEERFLVDDLRGAMMLRSRDDMIVQLNAKRGGGFRTVAAEG